MIFEKLFSKENKKDEIVRVEISDEEFNELKIKLSSGAVTVEQGERFAVNFMGKRHYLPIVQLEMEDYSLSKELI